MRIAIVSDIHGNLTTLEAVVAHLRNAAPDRVLQGGDFADDMEREVRRLQASGDPHLDWMSAMLRSGRPQMPGR